MSKKLASAFVEGFEGSFVLAATIVRVLVGSLVSVVAAFALRDRKRAGNP